MRVLVVCHEYPPAGGGGGRALLAMVPALAERGVRLDVVTTTGDGEPVASPAPGVEVHNLGTRRKGILQAGVRGMLSFVWRAGRRCRTLTAAQDYDVVHYVFSVPGGLAYYLSRRCRAKAIVVTLHGSDVPGHNQRDLGMLHRVLRPFNSHLLRRADAVVAVSETLRSEIRAFVPTVDPVVIHNGVDTELFHPGPRPTRDGLQVLYVGRLIALKRLDCLIDAMAKAGDNVTLRIVGDGPERAPLEEQARTLGIQDRVAFAGLRDRADMPDIYREADLFVLPSETEASPIMLLEAMASGLPVIGSDISSIGEIIRDGENGRLVPCGDSDALARAIDGLARNATERGRFSERSRIAATERSWESVAEAYAALYGGIRDRAE